MGKSAVNETASNFLGLYQGESSTATIKAHIEAADLLILIGVMPSDYNTGGFTESGIREASRIRLHGLHSEVDGTRFEGVTLSRLLRELCASPANWPSVAHDLPQRSEPHQDEAQSQDAREQSITHRWLWPRVGAWLQEKDVLITETGM